MRCTISANSVRRSRRLFLLLSVSIALLLSGAKCEHLESTGADEAFIRRPGEKNEEVARKEGPLLPLTVGNRWEMATQTVTLERDKQSKPKPGQEIITVIGPQKVGDKTGIGIDFRNSEKKSRQEIYVINDKEMSLLAAGFAEKMSITPPLPLVRFPLKEGEVVSWNGLLRFKGTTAPGTAYSRVTNRDTIKTPAGEFAVWRVDTVISTSVDGQSIALAANRWFAPGVGMVRQIWYAGKQRISKDLVRYKINGVSGGLDASGNLIGGGEKEEKGAKPTSSPSPKP
jgi:hypothetical protein